MRGSGRRDRGEGREDARVGVAGTGSVRSREELPSPVRGIKLEIKLKTEITLSLILPTGMLERGRERRVDFHLRRGPSLVSIPSVYFRVPLPPHQLVSHLELGRPQILNPASLLLFLDIQPEIFFSLRFPPPCPIFLPISCR